MQCHTCGQKAVIRLQHGSLCKNHFLAYFEEKVFKTINKFQMIRRDETLCVAASGGKDSLTVLYLTQKYCKKYKTPIKSLFALAIDEGIHDYREHTLNDLEKFCAKHTIPLHTVSNKTEFGYTLDEAFPVVNKGTNKKPCNVCGVWRRYLLNRHARKLGADKVITGHNADDEAQAIVMNIFKANTGLAAHLGPVSGIEGDRLFVQRVKPLYFCTEKEVRLYALLKKFEIQFAECPYARQGHRAKVQEMLNDFEQEYPGTKQGIIKSFLALRPLLQEAERQKGMERVRECTKCGEPAHGDVCNACKMTEVLNA